MTCIFLPSFPTTTPREKNFCSFPTTATSEMPQIRNSPQAHEERMHWNCMCSQLTRVGTSFHIFHSLNPLTECSVSPGQVQSNLYWFLARQHTSQQLDWNKGSFSRLCKGLCYCSHCPFWGPQGAPWSGYCFDLQQQMSDFRHWRGERGKGGSEPPHIWLWNIARFDIKKK